MLYPDLEVCTGVKEEDRSEGLGRKVVRGVAQHRASRVAKSIDDSTQEFRLEAGEKIEALATQIRQLGQRFESVSEAHRVARRLERMSDYLRFRPSEEIAADAWEAVRKYHLLWITGGILGTVLLYRAWNRRE